MDEEMDSQMMLTQETLDSESLLGLNFSFDGTEGALLARRVCQSNPTLETPLNLIDPAIPLHSLQTSVNSM